jgi:hypothetical protein
MDHLSDKRNGTQHFKRRHGHMVGPFGRKKEQQGSNLAVHSCEDKGSYVLAICWVEINA